jgi:hypothetical protein
MPKTPQGKDKKDDSLSPTSDRRVEANRTNAQRSTGPRTDEGKAVSKLNAVKTGLTGRTVLLPEDDVERYEAHLASWQAEFKPVGPRENALVQSIADAHWRLDRITRLEFALYAQGRVQFAEQFAAHDVALQPQLIEMQTFLAYERPLRNLTLQETRIRRQRERDEAEFFRLQEQRRFEENERRKRLNEATRAYHRMFLYTEELFDPAEHGFDFSIEEVEANYERVFHSGPDDDDKPTVKVPDVPEPGSRCKPVVDEA